MRFLGRLLYRIVRIICLIFLALLIYGLAILVFRQAYGVELPNIVRWMVQHGANWLNLHSK